MILDKLRTLFFQYWRFLNTIALVVGVILPWRWTGSDVEPFAAWPLYAWGEIQGSFRALGYIGNYAPQFLDYRATNIATLVGALSLALYIFGNLCQIILRTADTSKCWSLFLRATGLSSSLILLYDFLYPMINSGLTTGYYITATAIFGSILVEGNNNMNWNAKYPYLTAWIGLIALNALVGIMLVFVPFLLFRLMLQATAGFYIFRFVAQRNILPYIHKQ